MCYRSTPVEKLQFHLPGQQHIVYKENESADSVLSRIETQGSQLLSWFDVNGCEEESIKELAKDCTYEQIPTKFTWNKKDKIFKVRKRGFSVGRINFIPRKIEENYHLRILLNTAKGVTNFDDLKFHNGVLYGTFKEACFAKGLLEDDKEYIESIVETAFWASDFFTRKLFVIMLLSDSLTSPSGVWESTWRYLCDDIERIQREKVNQPDLKLSDEEKQNLCLIEIENHLASNGSSLANYKSMPQPNLEGMERYNRFIREERDYEPDKLNAFVGEWIGRLTDEQRKIYDQIVGAVFNNTGGVYFVYGFGGTGKTKLWEILSAAIRSKGLIVLNVASSGIASLLLVGGRTAHSRFGIPINVNEISLCNMKRGSELAALVKEASMIIWDEAPMMSKYCFESLDRSMRDIIVDASDKPFGGKVVVFGGDFRQILHVIPGGSRQDIVRASLCSSYLWKSCSVLTLTKNMRLLANLSPDEAQNIQEFSEWLLNVGDGNLTDNDGEADIDIPEEFLIKEANEPVEAIMSVIYGDSLDMPKNPEFFQKRAILCPTNDDVNQINEYLISKLQG